MKIWRRKKLEIKENYIFLVLTGVVFAFGMVGIVKTENYKSDSENRTLARFEHFTVKGFLDGSFQDNFENALSDQFAISEKIRVSYTQAIASLPTFGIERLACANKYLALSNIANVKRATFDCGDYILYRPSSLDKDAEKIFNENITKYSHVNKLADTYYYFVNDSIAYNFEKNRKTVDYAAILRERLSGDYTLESFDFSSYDEFKKYFYKTDHHWNYQGSYAGYAEIATMFGFTPVEPTGTLTYHEKTFGSHAKTTQNFSYPEEFVVYAFDIPEHDTYINHEKREYGHYQEYINHDYEYNVKDNYYAYFYGSDFGEVLFDFHQPKKDNLLIVSNSFSNAVNSLIAQHFNKTYVVDLRHYDSTFEEDFSVSKYIREHDIDKVLFIMSPSFVRGTETNHGLEL